MNITANWRKYRSDYKELKGDGFIANFTDPKYFVNKCPTEAFVGVSKNRGKLYIPSIASIWDHSSVSGEENGHGVYISFFNPEGKLLGGQQAGGANQWSADSISLEDRLELIKIASDLIVVRPELVLPFHEIVLRL